jgi:hypothetical protein
MKSSSDERESIKEKEGSERESTPVEPLLHPVHASNASSASLANDNQMPSEPSPIPVPVSRPIKSNKSKHNNPSPEDIRKNIYRLGQHSDTWGCNNCRLKGDIWDMKEHHCKMNKK